MGSFPETCNYPKLPGLEEFSSIGVEGNFLEALE